MSQSAAMEGEAGPLPMPNAPAHPTSEQIREDVGYLHSELDACRREIDRLRTENASVLRDLKAQVSYAVCLEDVVRELGGSLPTPAQVRARFGDREPA